MFNKFSALIKSLLFILPKVHIIIFVEAEHLIPKLEIANIFATNLIINKFGIAILASVNDSH
jgi:hypothetical protein